MQQERLREAAGLMERCSGEESLRGVSVQPGRQGPQQRGVEEGQQLGAI